VARESGLLVNTPPVKTPKKKEAAHTDAGVKHVTGTIMHVSPLQAIEATTVLTGPGSGSVSSW
jgi:hypothetical protein